MQVQKTQKNLYLAQRTINCRHFTKYEEVEEGRDKGGGRREKDTIM